MIHGEREIVMNYIIRQMTEKDIEAVQQVARKSWHTTYQGIIPMSIQEEFLTRAYSKEMLAKRLMFSHLFVAELDGKVVGFANYSPMTEQGVAELNAIYLLPDYQAMGIGTALLKAGLDFLKEVNIIYLNVEQDNEIGKRFYKRKGFNIVEKFTEDFSGHKLNTIRMALYL